MTEDIFKKLSVNCIAEVRGVRPREFLFNYENIFVILAE